MSSCWPTHVTSLLQNVLINNKLSNNYNGYHWCYSPLNGLKQNLYNRGWSTLYCTLRNHKETIPAAKIIHNTAFWCVFLKKIKIDPESWCSYLCIKLRQMKKNLQGNFTWSRSKKKLLYFRAISMSVMQVPPTLLIHKMAKKTTAVLGFHPFLSIILASWDPKVSIMRNQWCQNNGITEFFWCQHLGLMMLKWWLKRC